MANTIEEAVRDTFVLGDIDLDETPPCGMRPKGASHTCGKPSVVRVLFSCTCGFKGARFMCQEHYDELLRGDINCRYCREYVGKGLSWKVV